MSEPILFPDETQERLFQAARAAATDFIPLMISILTGLTTPTLKALRRAVRRGLVPAEAIARQMIWMLAGQLAAAAPTRTAVARSFVLRLEAAAHAALRRFTPNTS